MSSENPFQDNIPSDTEIDEIANKGDAILSRSSASTEPTPLINNPQAAQDKRRAEEVRKSLDETEGPISDATLEIHTLDGEKELFEDTFRSGDMDEVARQLSEPGGFGEIESARNLALDRIEMWEAEGSSFTEAEKEHIIAEAIRMARESGQRRRQRE